MTFYDIIMTFAFLVMFSLLGMLYMVFKPQFRRYKKWYYMSLAVKLISGLGYALVYTYYYTYGGDTVMYFQDAITLNKILFTNPIEFFQFIFTDIQNTDLSSYWLARELNLPKGTDEFFLTRIASIFTLLSLQSFFSTTLCFSFCSFIGVWHMFIVFARRYPYLETKLAFAILFVPSVFFWGSGLTKDSVTLGFLGVLLYAMDKIKRKEGRRLFNWAVAAVSGYVIFSIKAYILMSFLPALLIWYFLEYRERIRNKMVKTLALPVFLSISLVAVVLSISLMGQYSSKYKIEGILGTAKGMQSWHYVEGDNTSSAHGRGSSYSLGDYEENWFGLIQMIPKSVNVTLFRPYFNEVKNVMMIFTALESLIMLLATIYIFLGLGFFKVLNYLYTDSFLLMCFVFALFFAFAVGFTSYNFGALARYKIPCIPFYVASLFILQHKSVQAKLRRRMQPYAAKNKANVREIVSTNT